MSSNVDRMCHSYTQSRYLDSFQTEFQERCFKHETQALSPKWKSDKTGSTWQHREASFVAYIFTGCRLILCDRVIKCRTSHLRGKQKKYAVVTNLPLHFKGLRDIIRWYHIQRSKKQEDGFSFCYVPSYKPPFLSPKLSKLYKHWKQFYDYIYKD